MSAARDWLERRPLWPRLVDERGVVLALVQDKEAAERTALRWARFGLTVTVKIPKRRKNANRFS